MVEHLKNSRGIADASARGSVNTCERESTLKVPDPQDIASAYRKSQPGGAKAKYRTTGNPRRADRWHKWLLHNVRQIVADGSQRARRRKRCERKPLCSSNRGVSAASRPCHSLLGEGNCQSSSARNVRYVESDTARLLRTLYGLMYDAAQVGQYETWSIVLAKCSWRS